VHHGRRLEIISLPAVELAELFNLVATTLAAFAAFAALFLAIMGSNNPEVGQVPWAVMFLVLFGVAVFIFGRAVRYYFVGY
jgi:hypothetical protein